MRKHRRWPLTISSKVSRVIIATAPPATATTAEEQGHAVFLGIGLGAVRRPSGRSLDVDLLCGLLRLGPLRERPSEHALLEVRLELAATRVANSLCQHLA